jgi:hypothetical protein
LEDEEAVDVATAAEVVEVVLAATTTVANVAWAIGVVEVVEVVDGIMTAATEVVVGTAEVVETSRRIGVALVVVAAASVVDATGGV